ncbi:hypothetical protein CGLAU_01505 [Corynebacterium glaucum]|uniref:DUF202 domain-containing protein n=1 Tax=Corynebacterium glaucum TaxID=187491 RepID=A0A1Q2HTX7_9CORY|nr:DUF202 domain-containing protein [Corynebacterium glaucum]AQQ14292.1 hypothetical protein CGLAU_01505 [Corynebacterium glaucum]
MHADPGLQPERTSMSWTRTAVAMLVVSLILLRWAHVFGPWVIALIVLTLVAAVYVVLSNRAAYMREVAGIEHERVDPAIGRIFAMTATVFLLGVGSLVLVLLH